MINFFNSIYWMSFLLFFALFAKSLWFVYYAGLYFFPQKQKPSYYKKKAGLVVPIYNEEQSKLIDTINHIKQVKQDLRQIILVNDGSDNNVSEILHQNDDGSYEIVDLPKNQGKRFSQDAGIKKFDEDIDTGILMDSDTILTKDSIKNLLKYMSDEEVGGATAQILVKNRDDNFLTKCLAAFYWTSSNIWRKAPSNLGFMQVTNGQLSCYRLKYIREILDSYVNQTFLGVRCTISDDRFITHHIQTDYGKKIVYAEDAIAYTYVPTTLKKTYTMMKRWKLGSLRESILLLGQKNPTLALDVWANHLVGLFQMIVRIGIIILSLFYPIVMIYYLLVIVIISLLFGFELVVKKTSWTVYRVGYSILNEFIFSWVLIHAIFTIRSHGKWQTR